MCLDEEGKQGKKGIPRDIVVREVSVMQLKKSFRKGCQMFLVHMEEATKDKVASIEDHLVLRDFEDVFREILGLPPKRDIDLSIDFVPRATPVLKTPYIMGTLEIKELQMQLEEILKKGYICPSVSPWGSPFFFVKKKYGTLMLCIDYR
jgi:hypothetical protein